MPFRKLGAKHYLAYATLTKETEAFLQRNWEAYGCLGPGDLLNRIVNDAMVHDLYEDTREAIERGPSGPTKGSLDLDDDIPF